MSFVIYKNKKKNSGKKNKKKHSLQFIKKALFFGRNIPLMKFAIFYFYLQAYLNCQLLTLFFFFCFFFFLSNTMKTYSRYNEIYTQVT